MNYKKFLECKDGLQDQEFYMLHFFNKKIKKYEVPIIMHYSASEKYFVHDDGDRLIIDDHILLYVGEIEYPKASALQVEVEKMYSLDDVKAAINLAREQYWDIDNRGFSLNTEGDWSFKYAASEIIKQLNNNESHTSRN